MGYGDTLPVGYAPSTPSTPPPNNPQDAGRVYSPVVSDYGDITDPSYYTGPAWDALYPPSASPSTSTSSKGGGGGGGGAPPPVPHNPWLTTVTYQAPTGVKQATPDIVLFDDQSVDIEFLTNAFFEEFGGQELIRISRSDLIDGKQVSYTPIANLSRLNQKYNPNNVIAIAGFQENLKFYPIDLVLRGMNEPYFEDGYLVVEVDIVKKDELIEIEIVSDGTINKVEL